jgi:general secretion pathway protein C
MHSVIKIAVIALVAKAVTLPLLFVLPKSGVEYVERYSVNIYRSYPVAKAFGLKSFKQEKIILKKPLYKLTNLKLKGIYSSKKRGVVALEEAGKTFFLATGESYKGYKLIRVTPQKAIFEKHNRRYELEMEEKALRGTLSSSATKEDTASISISKKEIEHYKRHIQEVWKNISIKEQFDPKTKELTGFKVVRINKNSIFGRIGLQKGDIIVGANDKKFRTYADVFKLYNNIDKYDFVKLTIIRNNEEKELEYEIY